jgi:hypothetical protein
MASQWSDNKNKLKTPVYNFNEKLENKYFFINVNNKCVFMCLICSASAGINKKCNVDRHFITVHKDYISKYPNNSKAL